MELQQVKKEIEALRMTAQLLSGDDSEPETEPKSNLRQMVQLP